MNIPDKVRGFLHLRLLPDATVSFVFMPGQMGVGSRPLLSKNIETAEDDLVRTWGFTPGKARATIDELKQNVQVEREIDADRAMVAKLFPS